MTERVAAVLDACVLYSAFLRDLFMRLAVGFVFQPKWTAQIQDEWMRHVLANRPDLTRAQIERTRALMEQWGGDWQVGDYERLVSSLTLPDPDDRHVLAAAIVSEARRIVTFNLRDFPEDALTPHGVRAAHPDAFLSALHQGDSEAFVAALRSHRMALRHPPRTPEEYLAQCAANGLHLTAARLAEQRDDL